MDKTVAVKWMQCFDQKVEAEKDHLSELDGPIGDGDHGANLARGMAAAIEAINSTEPQSAAEVFKAVSMALISKVGGASGPLYGSAFMGMMKAEQAGQDLAGVLEAGLEMIKNVVMHKLVKKPWWMFGIRLLKLSNKDNSPMMSLIKLFFQPRKLQLPRDVPLM